MSKRMAVLLAGGLVASLIAAALALTTNLGISAPAISISPAAAANAPKPAKREHRPDARRHIRGRNGDSGASRTFSPPAPNTGVSTLSSSNGSGGGEPPADHTESHDPSGGGSAGDD